MKEKVLVTGSDGMLGSMMVRVLLEKGYLVRAMVQAGRCAHTLKGLDIELVTADIRQLDELDDAVDGCDFIIHAAATTSYYPSRNVNAFDVNLEGTMNVLSMSFKHSIRRLVHISSASVFTPGTDNALSDESSIWNPDRTLLDYINSKYYAHKAVLKAVEAGLDAVIVCPTFMFGPYDSGPGSGQMILALIEGRIKAIPPGGKNFTCSRDVATGAINALSMGKKGATYLLGHQNLSYKQIFELIAGVVGVPKPGLSLPAALVKAGGYLSNMISDALHRQPMVSREMAQLACQQHYYNAEKAVQELQLPQTPIEVGIRDAWNWFKENGYLQSA